jgi:hypothetical protein
MATMIPQGHIWSANFIGLFDTLLGNRDMKLKGDKLVHPSPAGKRKGMVATKAVLVIQMLLIAAIVLLVPATTPVQEQWLNHVFSWTRQIAMAYGLAKDGYLEAPATIGMAFAMLFGLCSAAIGIGLGLNMQGFKKITGGLSKPVRLLYLTMMLMLAFVPYFVELTPSIASGFFYRVANSRLWLLVWCEILLVTTFSLWLYVFYELSSIFKKKLEDVSRE